MREKYVNKRLVMADDISHEDMDTGSSTYSWWPVGVLEFTTEAHELCPRLKQKIWVICIYQGIATVPVAWALSLCQLNTPGTGWLLINDSEVEV